MLIHASVPADDPERVARVVADLWRGEAMPFPPFPGAFVAFANDDRRTVLEAYPRGREHVPADGIYTVRSNANPSPHCEVHIAIGTPLSADEVLAIAARERWLAQRSDRGGIFNVVEFWLENKFLLEVMPEPEIERYRENLTPAGFRERFGMREARDR